MGIDPRETSLKVGIFGAEPWTNKMRTEIDDAFNMDALDILRPQRSAGPASCKQMRRN